MRALLKVLICCYDIKEFHVPLSQGITMRKSKTKAIQADLDIFRDIHTYSGIIRHIQELFRRIQAYSQSCVIMAYSEHQYIQNHGIFRTLANIYNGAFCEKSSRKLYLFSQYHLSNSLLSPCRHTRSQSDCWKDYSTGNKLLIFNVAQQVRQGLKLKLVRQRRERRSCSNQFLMKVLIKTSFPWIRMFFKQLFQSFV